MANSDVFEWMCEQIEADTALNALEARGTVRLALKQAGFDARSVSREQMRAIIERILPGELKSRGVDAAERLCKAWIEDVPADPDSAPDTPEAIFQRLGR